MKTLKNIFALMIAILATNAAMASGLRVNVLENDADLTVVEISNNKMSNFEIEVSNAYGEELYRMKTKSPVNEFKKRYNFSGLEDGIYWYSVKIDKEKVVKKMEIEEGRVNVVEVRKTLEPYIKQENDMIKLSFLNFQNEDVKVYIYGSDNNLVAEADLGNEFSITKAINVEELEKGEYEMVITHNYDYYEHDFSVN